MRETTSSLPRLTAAALSRALNLEQGSRLLTVRLPGAIDCEALRECFSLNGNGVPNICELEPGKQNTDSGDAAPVFIDATACVRKRFREINSACEALINDLEPGYLGFCDWEAYLWCLYALALSGRTRAAVLLPFESLDNAEQARAILLREGLVESVLYHPLAESPMHGMYALIVLSTGNRSVSFRNAATPMPRLRFADGARHPNLPLAFSPDWSDIECDSRKTVSIETVELETRSPKAGLA